MVRCGWAAKCGDCALALQSKDASNSRRQGAGR
jgi:hypothetical protein